MEIKLKQSSFPDQCSPLKVISAMPLNELKDSKQGVDKLKKGAFMKKIIALIALSSLPLGTTFAQDRDYGNLVPEDHFEIKQSKTKLKDNADISSFEIAVTPTKEEFFYKVSGVKTPKKNLLSKKSNFKLSVDKNEGKITQISSVSFTDNADKGGVHAVQSSSILPSGFVNSNTNCYEDYKLGIFGTKRKESGFKCVTVNKEVCEYIEKNKIDSELVEKINSCSDMLSKISDHQESLYKLSKKDQKNDLSAMTKLNGRVSDARNFYELESKTLKDVSEIVLGYGSAISHCEFLKENNYFAPKEESSSGTGESKSDGAKEE